MTSLSTVKQEFGSDRYMEGQRPLTDAEIFEQAGFYSAAIGDLLKTDWQEIHQWCKQQFGKEHYTWTGSKFWFETEEAAVLFTLRWG